MSRPEIIRNIEEENLAEHIDKLYTRINNLRSELKHYIKEHGDKHYNIEDRLDKIEKRLEKLEKHLYNVEDLLITLLKKTLAK